MPEPGPRRILTYLLLISAVAYAGAAGANLLASPDLPESHAWLIKATLVMLLVAGVTHLYMRRAGQHWGDYAVIPARLPAAVVRGGLAGLALAGAWAGLVWMLAPFGLSWNASLVPAQFLAASLGTIAMGCAEEIGYRSYALRALRPIFGAQAAVFVPSLLFVAVHVAGGVPWPAGLLVVGSMSVLLGVVMLKTGDLPLVISLHIATNLVQDNLLRLSPTASLFAAQPLQTAVPPEPLQVWIAIGAFNLAAAAGVAAWYRARHGGSV